MNQSQAPNEIVIARYGESLDWIARVPDDFAVRIVNKGAPLTSPAVIARADSVVERPNAGRESETFLSHILESTSGGDGYTVFAQGDPFEHSPDIIEILGLWRDWDSVQPLSWRWKSARDIPPAAILDRERAEHLGGARVRPEYFSLATWTPLGFSDPGTLWLESTYRSLHDLPPGANIASHFLRKCGLDAIADRADAHLLGRFSYGALFAARRSMFGALGADQLGRLRQASLGHEVYGYVIERLWLHLFAEPFVLPAPIPPDLLSRASPPAAPGFVPPDKRGKNTRRLDRITRRIREIAAG